MENPYPSSIPLSPEQQYIVELVKQGNNVIVDSVAGTGKTTLLLSIASENHDKTLLQMTYNSSLRIEVNTKIKEQSLTNIRVHTFHSLAVRYYHPHAYTDQDLRHILLHSVPPREPIPPIDIFIIDETQDMTPLYYRFIRKFLVDMFSGSSSKIQLLLLGDYMQGLYEFKGADTRFLTLADKIWAECPYLHRSDFVKATMNTSFRITNQMSGFINEVLLGEERMRACKDGPVVHYIRRDRYIVENIVIAEIKMLFERGVKAEDIFVLGASVKGTANNIRRLENRFVEEGIPCHIPMLENERMDERVIQGKVVFSTFHSVKGRQRRFVFVVGFDNSYFEIFSRNSLRDKCPNTIYVATTRASEGLYLLESSDYPHQRPLEFLRLHHGEMGKRDYMRFRGIPKVVQMAAPTGGGEGRKAEFLRLTPSEMIKFIAEDTLDAITPLIESIYRVERSAVEGEEVDIPMILETRHGYEEVSHLNGIVIPFLYFDKRRGGEGEGEPPFILKMIDEKMDLLKTGHDFLRERVKELPRENLTIEEYLYAANILSSLDELLYFKVKQIGRDEYTWLTEEMVDTCLGRIEGVVMKDENIKMEEVIITDESDYSRIDAFISTLSFPAYFSGKRIRFHARADLITTKTFWELKCSQQITLEHQLQLIIYMWIGKMLYPTSTLEYKLLNIRTGEIQHITATIEELNAIVAKVIEGKYREPVVLTEDEFLRGLA